MKKLFLAGLAAIAFIALAGCDVHISNLSGWSSSSLKASTNIVQSAAIPAGVKVLEVDNAFGSIHITGSDASPANWTQNLTVRARDEATVQQIASNFICKAELDGDRLKLVVTPLHSSKPHSFQSDLEITVPKSITVRAHNRYGRTDISDLKGDVEAASQFGAMELHDIDGAVHADTSYAALDVNKTGSAVLRNQFGSIQAADIHGSLEADTSYATLDVHDIAGTVKLRNQFGRLNVEKAGEADLKTSYAELRAHEIHGDAHLVNQFGRVAGEDISGSVKAVTSYGPMEITGPGTNFVCDNQFGGISLQATSKALANIEARTSYAALEVRLPGSLKPSVQAHTTYGDIESDFPVVVKSASQNSRVAEQSGAPTINLRNQNGKIRVIGD